VAVVGSFIVDLAVTTPRIPIRGENILGHTFKMGPGGKGANAAAAMARLGANSAVVGSVGSDDLAVVELEALRREAVDVTGVVQDADAHTGIAVIMVDDQGENTILVVLGANATLTAEQALGALEHRWNELDALLVNFEIPEPVVSAVIDEGTRRGVMVVVDAGPPRDHGPATWGRARIISPNRLELEALAGRSLPNPKEIEEAACQILRHGPEAVVLKMGAEGALVFKAEGSRAVPPFPVEVVDTTGAGDAFTGALVVGLAEGLDLVEATKGANAAGALAVTRFGTMPAMPTRTELDRFLSGR
jgi:ribokinase